MLDASRKGGSRKAVILPECDPLDAQQARGIIAGVITALLEGAIDPTTARSVGYLIQVERKVAESEELERRVGVLEDQLRTRNGVRQ